MTTSPDRWEQVSDLFDRATALPPEARAAFLDTACAGDLTLRAEVASLLGEAESSDGFFARLADRAGLPATGEAQLERLAGQRLGNWRLVRLVGRGGMGAVYLAERADEQLEMQAALKILRVGMVSEDAHQRFLAERQILARLHHRNIAQLLDAGVTDDGTPYYVMEYVDGVPIDAYGDRERLSIVQRLELFLQICAAVAHAHRNLIVHRDLKPSNILVTDAGEVKLLDFGIARMLQPTETMYDASAVYGHPMTVAYASPEQLRGGNITTATDVYALGLLLYELLTGTHPYRHGLASSADAERLICETLPTAPSVTIRRLRTVGTRSESDPTVDDVAATRQLPAERLQRLLAGDLDTIVMMALRKEPERRYRSAAHLADDISRYLAQRPVSAQPDTLGYRVSRFVKRNRVAVTGVAAVAALVAALVGQFVRSAVVTARQARAIEQEARTADEVSNFLVDLFRQVDPQVGYGDTVRARALLDQGSQRIRERLTDQPAVRGRLLTTLAGVYANLGLYDQAQALQRDAATVYRELPDGDPHPVAMAYGTLAGYFKAARSYDSASLYFRKALALQQEVPIRPLDLAGTLTGFAGTLRELGHPDSAVPLLERAIAVRREMLGGSSLSLLYAFSELALTMRALEQPDSAEALYRQILAGLATHGDSGRELTAATLNNLAYLHRTRDDLAGADSLYRAALVVERQLGNATNLLTVLVNLASLASERGDSAETQALLEERIAIARKTWPDGHWRTGAALNALAIHYIRDHDDCASAIPLLREQADIYTRTIGADHRWTAQALLGLGNCLRRERDYPAAESALLKALASLQRAVGIEHEEAQLAVRRLVALYEAWGRPARAASYRAALAPTAPETR